jgi:hypothetical protein
MHIPTLLGFLAQRIQRSCLTREVLRSSQFGALCWQQEPCLRTVFLQHLSMAEAVRLFVQYRQLHYKLAAEAGVAESILASVGILVSDAQHAS